MPAASKICEVCLQGLLDFHFNHLFISAIENSHVAQTQERLHVQVLDLSVFQSFLCIWGNKYQLNGRVFQLHLNFYEFSTVNVLGPHRSPLHMMRVA